MSKLKHNIPLFVGILVPLLMILFVAASVYLPALFVKPAYDFIYASQSDYRYAPYLYGTSYDVESGKVVRRVQEPPANFPDPDFYKTQPEPKLYYYDIVANKSREINLEEAQNYILDTSAVSPDGFELAPASSGGGFPFSFDSNEYGKVYMKSKSVSKKLNIQQQYYNDFSFLGWVKK